MTDDKTILEAQLRECYARTVYTHKTQEKCADILLNWLKYIKSLQICFSVIATGGAVTTLFKGFASAEVITALFSAALLALNLFIKENDLGAIAQQHRQAGAKLWLIRERYLSLLTDMQAEGVSLESIRSRRDNLIEEQYSVYDGAPSTNSWAYRKARKALKEQEEMTFSDEEIDQTLPKALRITSNDTAVAKKSTS